jgi:ClpP class serine protease
VWTGAQAKGHQLIDRLGGLFDVCHSLSDTLQAPIGELVFWDPETKGGFGRLKQSEQDSPLLGTELAEASLGPLLDSLRLAQWFATERTLMLSPVQFSGTSGSV